MILQRYFFSIVLIFCSSITISAAQKLKAVAISGGEEHSLVVTDNNEVFDSGFGGNGQLGNGTTYSQTIFKPALKGQMKTSTGYLENISFAGAGWLHSLFLDKSGKVLACGGNGKIGI